MSFIKMFLFACLLLCCSLQASENDSKLDIIALTPEQIADSRIEILRSAPVTLIQTFTVPAKIILNELHQAVVVAKAPGIVTKVSKNIGDTVQQDEILAVLESKEMADAKATYITAYKREALASKTLIAEEALKEKKITSEQDYLHTLLAAEEARINLEVAAQQLYLLGVDQNDLTQLINDGLKGLCCYPIKASLSGVITDKNITLGSHVGSDQEVFKIADLDTVWVEMGVYSNQLTGLKPGHKIFLSPLKADHPTAQAEITHISPVIDEHTRTATAIASLSNSSKDWYPGSYVRAEIIADEIPVRVAVAKEAIQEIDDKTYVFVRHPEGFEKREVKTGKADANHVEIISGLEINSPYAATHAFLLKAEDGKKDAEL